MSNDASPIPPTPSAPQVAVALTHILVPVDFSPRAQKALAYGVALARQFGAKLTVLHVIELAYVSSGLGEVDLLPIETGLRGNASEELARLVQSQTAGIATVSQVVRTGQPWYEIAEAAREAAADLVIVGTHGYTGLKHVLLGSTAERVVRHAPCPVLVVREQEQEFVKGVVA